MEEKNIWMQLTPCWLFVGGIIIFLMLFLAALDQDKLILFEGSIRVISQKGTADGGCWLRECITSLLKLKSFIMAELAEDWLRLFGA